MLKLNGGYTNKIKLFLEKLDEIGHIKNNENVVAKCINNFTYEQAYSDFVKICSKSIYDNNIPFIQNNNKAPR